MRDYLEILKEWEHSTANPAIYEHLAELFPAYGFRRVQAGGDDDHWASSLKKDLSAPKRANKEKTVVYARDFAFREQGDWYNKTGVIDKLIEDYDLDGVYNAYIFAAQKLGLSLPNVNGDAGTHKSREQKLLEDLEKYFIWNLENNTGSTASAARNYLSKVRGFSPEAIRGLHFGMVPGWDKVEAYVTSGRMGYHLEELENACGVRNEDGFTNVGQEYVLSIPYRSAGRIKGFLFRSIRSDVHPKYLANKNLDRKSSFFNINRDQDEKELVIVEGELDALTATAHGFRNVVAIGGSSISGERRNQVFDALNRNVKKITICLDLDKDKDGNADYNKRLRENRRSILTILNIKPDFRELYISDFPFPTDPDEFIRMNGEEAFAKILAEAKPWWDYLADEMNRQ